VCFPFGRCPLGREWTLRDTDWSDRESDGGVAVGEIPLIEWMQDHRRLRVWKKAHALAIEVRRATRLFPRTGYASLQSQIVRAAESIVINIVEGCGSRSPKDFARFLDISIKSTSELECQLELAKDYGVLKPYLWQRLTREAVDVRRMLCGFRAKVLQPDPNPSGSKRPNGQRPNGKRTNLDSPRSAM
jgi:four helix bundle protein